MKPQERFAVFVKSLGVWLLVTGLGTLPLATFGLRQFSDAEDFFYMIMQSIGEPLFMCVAGLWLLRSNWIADVTYPKLGVTNSSADLYPDQSATSLELFSALTKTLGVFFFLHGITILPHALSDYHSVSGPSWARPLLLFEIIAVSANSIVFGVLLLIATNWFIRLGFSELLDDTNPADNEVTTYKSPQLALFAVIVKTLGLWFFIHGLAKFPHAITQAFAGGIATSWEAIKQSAGIFALPVMSVLMGGLCFFATDLFVKLAFSKRPAAVQ
ncbi:MAG TPA: hypothetical protein VMJ32_02140 [Pirellulales bacterium]|nr:hypothetical protein [Pirellulales bacterium]